jgi:hypothetical protein
LAATLFEAGLFFFHPVFVSSLLERAHIYRIETDKGIATITIVIIFSLELQ